MESKRIIAIDYLRGLIMVFMALDHCSAMVARTHFFEIWGFDFLSYPNGMWAFTRIISHLCAPGFFLLMGISMRLFAINRQKSGWDKKQISLYFLKRGGLIFLLMIFIEFPAWGLSSIFSAGHQTAMVPGSGISGFTFPTTVLYGLSFCMIISSVFLYSGWKVLIPISIFCFLASGLFISQANPYQTFTLLEHMFIVPGSSGRIFTIYPVIPWLGVTTAGMYLGERWFNSQRDKRNEILILALILLVAFLASRILAWGNFQMISIQSGIEFFTLIKYPPSFSFISFTLGINLLFLYFFLFLKRNSISEILNLYGKTALFFYLLHLYIYAFIGLFYPEGTGIIALYLYWIIGLIPIFFLCKYYLNFKSHKPKNSIWRMI